MGQGMKVHHKEIHLLLNLFEKLFTEFEIKAAGVLHNYRLQNISIRD